MRKKRRKLRSICDVNVLLGLLHRRHSKHQSALAWLDTQGRRSAFWCRLTQLSVLRLLSTPAVMGNHAHTQHQAWQTWDVLTSDERIAFADEPVGLEAALRAFTAGSTVSPKVWQDAYLAAFARSGAFQLVTFDKALAATPGVDTRLLSSTDPESP